MDRIMARPAPAGDFYALAHSALTRVAPLCRWTDGRWETLGRSWNEIEYTPRDVNRLRDFLIQVENETGRAAA
jgi:hypothetical protein